jgi:hypothetical protein
MDEKTPAVPDRAENATKAVGTETGSDAAGTSAIPASQSPAPSARRPSWLRLTVAILFALFYAYDLFEAISDTFGVSAQITKYNENASLIGINTVAIPWAVLIANLLLPIVVYGLALLISRRRNLGILAIVLLAGLAVVAALSLSLTVLAGILT